MAWSRSPEFALGTQQLLARSPHPAPSATPSPLATLSEETHSFEVLVATAIATSAATVDIGLLAVNVDYFDVIVASHGVEVGHQVMRSIAQRIRALMVPGDAIARYSEDGYALMCAPAATPADIRLMAERVAVQFQEPIVTAAGQLAVTISVGIASTNGRSTTTDAAMLLRQAKSAVATAQRKSRSQIAVFDDAHRRQILRSHELEQQLRSALDDGQVGVSYQPVASLHSGEIVGIEALARWQHDEFADMDPRSFVAIAERSGLIHQLGQSVLGKAMKQGQKWLQGQKDVAISVNLSSRQLVDPNLIPMVEQLLTDSGMSSRKLYLEISESVVMSDVATSMTILGHLKDVGVRLAIGDFGTGYSSLSYLHRLPVDVLKIDQSFVQGIYRRDDRVITKAIIDLAHTLGMKTIAQGVESHLQAEVLHALNCDMAQGFYFHPPSPAELVDFSPIDFENSGVSGSPGSPSAPEETALPFAQR